MKIRIFFMVICFLLSTAVKPQESKESTIIISKENLISLIKTIKEKRDAILLDMDNNKIPQYRSDLTPISYKFQESNSQQQQQLNAIYAKLQSLEYDIKLLSSSLNGEQKPTPQKGSLTVVTTPGNAASTYSTITADKTKSSARYSEEISELEKKINALKKEAQEQLLAKEKQKEDSYDELIRILNSTKTSKDTLIIEKRELTDYYDLLKKFDNFRGEVFFDNNSKAIKDNQTLQLDKIVTILKATEKIDVYLKGFASNKGNANYNQNLSVQRTENVKKYLVKKGVHPSRILTQYHGIDYSATTEELARRVELSFIVKNNNYSKKIISYKKFDLSLL